MDFDTPASMRIPSTPHTAVTLTFDLQNVIRPLVGAGKYSLAVLAKLFKPFRRYHGNNI